MRTERVKGVATIFELEELEAMAKVSEALEELERRIGVENTLMYYIFSGAEKPRMPMHISKMFLARAIREM